MSSVRRQSCSRMVISVGGAGAPPVRHAAQPAGGLRQAFERPDLGVRPLVQQRESSRPEQGVGNHVLPAFHPGRQELRHQRVGIPVDDQPGQAVRLAVDQAQAVAADVKAGPGPDGALDQGVQECCVYALRLVETPGPRADFRTRAEGRPGQELSAAGLHFHGFARIGASARDGRVKNPGMAAQQGALLALPKSNRFHAGYCRRFQPRLLN